MTMLDRMRRHKSWLKWSLAIVVVSFVLLYIPSFMRDSAQGASNNAVVADVDGREVTAAQFRRVYQQQMQAYRQSYGANVDERLLKQLGHRPAHRPADGRGRGVAGRGTAPGHHGERRGSPRADPGAAGLPGERPVHRRPALPPAPADAEPADAARRVRRPGPPQHRRRKAAGGADRLDHGERRGRRSASSRGATRRSSLRSSRFPADKFRGGLVASDAEVQKYFDDHKDSLPHSARSARSAT